jgi:hypothetical protein
MTNTLRTRVRLTWLISALLLALATPPALAQATLTGEFFRSNQPMVDDFCDPQSTTATFMASGPAIGPYRP